MVTDFEKLKVLISRKGVGGFGFVDVVEDEVGNYFAKKTFEINQGPGFPKSMEENVLKRFKREARAQQNLSHPNIVPIYFANLDDFPPYYVMPLALASLQDDLKNIRNIGFTNLDPLIDIMAGLEEIHNIGHFHRDLKPGNVLRFSPSPLGGRDFYAIGDFGLASINESKLSNLTQTGMQKGSDYYTAPEIVKSMKNPSASCDIYSLGCILHDFVGVEERVPHGEIREPGPYSDILLSCTRTNPQRRFKSVSAVREAILSVGILPGSPSSIEAGTLLDFLRDSTCELVVTQWRQLQDYLDDHFPSTDCTYILHNISLAHIERLSKIDIDIFNRMCGVYSTWIRESSFNFETCDGLAVRLREMIRHTTDLAMKGECIMAILYMGINHNRFYVERMFANQINSALDPSLIKRLAFQFKVDGEDLCKAIRHLKYSINYDVGAMHPELLSVYKTICE